MLNYQNRHFLLRMKSNIFIICYILLLVGGGSQKLHEVNSNSSVPFSHFRGRSDPRRCVENVIHEHSRGDYSDLLVKLLAVVPMIICWVR